jgi:hypothetical protein
MFEEIRCSCKGDPAIPSTGYRVKRMLSFLSISGVIDPFTAIWVALLPRANDPRVCRYRYGRYPFNQSSVNAEFSAAGKTVGMRPSHVMY